MSIRHTSKLTVTLLVLAYRATTGFHAFPILTKCNPLRTILAAQEYGQGMDQEAMMESWLGRIRSLHTELDVAYRYDEWRRLLGAFSAQEQDISPLKP